MHESIPALARSRDFWTGLLRPFEGCMVVLLRTILCSSSESAVFLCATALLLLLLDVDVNVEVMPYAMSANSVLRSAMDSRAIIRSCSFPFLSIMLPVLVPLRRWARFEIPCVLYTSSFSRSFRCLPFSLAFVESRRD